MKTKVEKISELIEKVKPLLAEHWFGVKNPSDRDVIIYALERTLALEDGWRKPLPANSEI